MGYGTQHHGAAVTKETDGCPGCGQSRRFQSLVPSQALNASTNPPKITLGTNLALRLARVNWLGQLRSQRHSNAWWIRYSPGAGALTTNRYDNSPYLVTANAILPPAVWTLQINPWLSRSVNQVRDRLSHQPALDPLLRFFNKGNLICTTHRLQMQTDQRSNACSPRSIP